MKFVLRFLFAYFTAIFAILLLFGCYCGIVYIDGGNPIAELKTVMESDNIFVLYGSFQERLFSKLPTYGDIFDEVYSNGFGAFLSFVQGKIEDNKEWTTFLAELFPSLVTTILAAFFGYLLRRLNIFLKIFGKGKNFFSPYKIAFWITSFIWALTAFCMATVVMYWLEKNVNDIYKRYNVYWCIFLASIILHALFLTWGTKGNKFFFHFIFRYLWESLLNIIKAYIIWWTCFKYPIEYLWGILFFFLIYGVLEDKFSDFIYSKT